MEAKAKAKDLVNSFVNYANPGKTDSHIVKRHNAKQCALICCDEIIQVAHPDPYPRKKTKMDREFWIEVKKQIEKL